MKKPSNLVIWRAIAAVGLIGCACWPGAEAASSDFDYPVGLVSPPQIPLEGLGPVLYAPGITAYEAPMQVWQTWRVDQTMWNCVARYHPTALDAITKNDPSTRAPEEYHTSEARALCIVYAINKLVPELVPSAVDLVSAWLVELGLDASIMTDDDAQDAAMEGNFSPRVLGSAVAAEILADMQSDGWNHLGTTRAVKMKRGRIDLTDSGTKCTANCRPFSDTTGYKPQNSPWEITVPSAWQPLTESDGNGFFYAQEHVTPHIGYTAKPVILSSKEISGRRLDAPKYDYVYETDLVIDRVADLADDDYKKVMVEFMDNKLNLAGGLLIRLRAEFSMSLEAMAYYHYGLTSSEVDVVLLAWKEKIRHDLIRPTSRVQERGEEQVYSFANGGEAHDASDWVPYIRVMPHAEYPSGSACICTALNQYVDSFVQDAFGIDTYATTWKFPAGWSALEPGVVPAEAITVSFDTMTELRDTCGNSRAWGGMHFTSSVTDGYDLCDGVGEKGYGMMQDLLRDATFESLLDGDGVIRYSP